MQGSKKNTSLVEGMRSAEGASSTLKGRRDGTTANTHTHERERGCNKHLPRLQDAVSVVLIVVSMAPPPPSASTSFRSPLKMEAGARKISSRCLERGCNSATKRALALTSSGTAPHLALVSCNTRTHIHTHVAASTCACVHLPAQTRRTAKKKDVEAHTNMRTRAKSRIRPSSKGIAWFA